MLKCETISYIFLLVDKQKNFFIVLKIKWIENKNNWTVNMLSSKKWARFNYSFQDNEGVTVRSVFLGQNLR